MGVVTIKHGLWLLFFVALLALHQCLSAVDSRMTHKKLVNTRKSQNNNNKNNDHHDLKVLIDDHVYHGPDHICQKQTSNYTSETSWCQYLNPFSSQFQLLFPQGVPVDPSAPIPTKYWCSSNNNDGHGQPGELCKSIVAFRTVDVNDRFLKARVVVLATVDNNIYMMKYVSKGLPKVIPVAIPNSDNCEVIGMDIFSYSTVIVLQRDQAKNKDRLSAFDLTVIGRLKLVWSIEEDEILQWRVMPSDKNAEKPIYAVLTPQNLQFYTVTGEKSCSLNIKGANGNILGFDWMFQAGRFDVWQEQNRNPFPMRIPSVLPNGITQRLLIFVYDSIQVRMIHFGSIESGSNTTCHKDMDLSDMISPSSLNSLAWVMDKSSRRSDGLVSSTVTTIKPFAATIRDPIVKSDGIISCSSAQFAPSQQVYLSVAVTKMAAGTRVDTSITTVHLEDLAMVDFDSYSKICQDETTPDSSDECVFNPAMRTKDKTFTNCKGCAQQVTQINYDWVDSIETRFMDAPSYINGMNTYQRNGTLEPFIVCETVYQYLGNNEMYMDCIESVTLLYTNATLGKCDPLILNVDDNLLQPFFESFWQDNIFVLAHNFNNQSTKAGKEYAEILPMPNPSAVHVISRTMSLSPNEPFGNFNLTLMNKITATGQALDMHVSQNGQHMYLAQARYQYEMQSLTRFNEICSMLNNDPDSVLLSKYKQYCISFPPAPVDMRQFGMLSSSCANGVLCNRFSEFVVESSVTPGHFVFNHLTQVPCPAGVYCSNGVIHSCPKGFLCDETGLPAPHPCPIDDSDDTCYLSPLNSISCPFGAVCPTADQPPILAPPGYALWLFKQGEHVLGKDVKACLTGDYCPLALQVTVSALNYRLNEVADDPDDILECPANTYCSNSSILSPTPCYPYNDTRNSTVMPYCPPGTYDLEPCPAGFYCSSPSTIKNCSKTEYCPPGSFLSDVCKEGYYCPDPTQQIKCPSGYFCRQGSTNPVRCSFLGQCPAGSTKDSLTSFAVGVVVGVLLLILVAYLSFKFYVSLYQKISRKQRLQALEEQNRKNTIRKNRRKISINARPTERSALLAESDLESEADQEEEDTVSLLRPTFTADIQFEELGLTVRSTGKRVLYGVTGEIRHGELTCVMGLSGAGKSTFITTLAGRAHYGIPEGIIRVNGVERKLTSFNLRVGFVPQEDIMCRDCTVEDTLFFAAKTRLDRRTTNKQITYIVNNVIRVLRLEDIRHSIIGDETNRGISGGQRKRVNVGIELVAQPVILFCDEPTSGLDSASSKEVCEVLQDIAKSGITVITVIHQPRFEIFEMFEQLLLLGKGGKTSYLGPVKGVRKYFEGMGFVFPPQVNVADYLMDITAGNALPADNYNSFTLPYNPEQLQEKWKMLKGDSDLPVHENTHSLNNGANEFKNPSLSYFRQFWMCFLRSITQQIRGIMGILQDFFLVFICGLFLGLIYYNKTYVGPVESEISNQCPKALRSLCEMPLDDPVFTTASMMNLAMALTGVMASLKVFGKEKIVYARESQTGLSTFCYFWSKDISILPMNILAPWIFLVMYYTLLDPRAQLYEIYYVLFLIYWTSYGLGYLVSIVINNVNAQLFAVVFIFIMNVFSGSTTTRREFKDMSPPFNILPFTSYLSFGLEMSYLSELVYYKHIYNINRSLDLFGYDLADLKWMWAALLGYGLAFRILAFIALWFSRPDSMVLKIKNSASNWVLMKVKDLINAVCCVKVAVAET